MKAIYLEALLMPNGEILCLGKTIGWEKEFESVIQHRLPV